MLEPFLSPFMLRAYMAIFLLSLISLGGAVAVLRGVAYLPAESSHAALGGAALALFVGYITGLSIDPYFTAITFSIVAALVVAYVSRHSGPEVTGIAIAGALAISVSIYAFFRSLMPSWLQAKVDGYLLGDILLLSPIELIELALMVTVGTLFFILFYHEIMYICFDPEGASAMGLNVSLYDYMLFGMMGLAAGLATKAVGSLLVFALVMAPAAIAREFAGDAKSLLLITMSLTLLFGYIGLFISALINLATSGTIAIITSIAYILIIGGKRIKNKIC
jgi:ABC-type Mn2+/Zn2+ transport system permease subunit